MTQDLFHLFSSYTFGLRKEHAEGLLDQRLASDPAARPAVDTPIHRHASAVLPAASGVRHRTGVVLSWPESDATQLPELDITVLGVPDIAGLLQLAGAQSTAAWVDAEGGSVSIMTQGTGRLVARCVREADPAASMEGILRESAALAGNVDDALSATGTLHLNAAAAETLADPCPDAAEDDERQADEKERDTPSSAAGASGRRLRRFRWRFRRRCCCHAV